MYPSWFSLLALQPEVATSGTWQWVTREAVDPKRTIPWRPRLHAAPLCKPRVQSRWPLGLIEAFSGHPVLSLRDFEAKYGAIGVPCLVAGVGGRGIGVTNREGVAEVGSLPGLDPVKMFRDRMYVRHGLHPPEPQRSISGGYITVVESKRELSAADAAAALAAQTLGMELRTVRWEELTFVEQLQVCASTAVLVVGVGTVRVNSFLLPEGAVEVQTCTPANWALPSRRFCFDAHLGTLMSHVHVVHLSGYSADEARAKRSPIELAQTIEDAAIAASALPGDRRLNLPSDVRLRYAAVTAGVPELFWAQSGSIPLQARSRSPLLPINIHLASVGGATSSPCPQTARRRTTIVASPTTGTPSATTTFTVLTIPACRGR